MYFSCGKGQLMSEEEMEEKVGECNFITCMVRYQKDFELYQVMENILECAKKSLYECEIMDPKKT